MNLIPSENVTSLRVRQLLQSDFGHRYTARDGFYRGTNYTDELEAYVRKLAAGLFRAEYADVRPLSGHVANLAVLFAFTEPGDAILSIYPDDGGYPGISDHGAAKRLGLKNVYFPLKSNRIQIDVEKSKEVIEAENPKVVIFGASMILFPHPVKELERTAHNAGAVVAYDGSHVLGLIGGKQFQSPFEDGADLILGSTHKSLFGPQGGILLARKEFGEALDSAIDPSVVDNAHWNRIAALGQALEEVEAFGMQYARQVIKNAQTLGRALNEEKIPVRGVDEGITESHQVVLAYGAYKEGGNIAKKLEECNIITDVGIRLGTCEITRWGMKDPEMQIIAGLISTSIRGSKSSVAIKKEVANLRRDFNTMQFCFD